MEEIRSDWGKTKTRIAKMYDLMEEIEKHPDFLKEENISSIRKIVNDILECSLTIESALKELKDIVKED